MTATMDDYHGLNIVVLGASFGGISATHHIYYQMIPELRDINQNYSYRIMMISPNSHIFWNISAARAIVSTKLISLDQSFIPLKEGFKDYDPERFELIQGTASDLNTQACTITVQYPINPLTKESKTELGTKGLHERLQSQINSAACRNSYSQYPKTTENSQTVLELESKFDKFKERIIKYHALVVATGTTANSPLLSLRGSHESTQKSIQNFQARLPHAKVVIIAGGGCSGVEVAGQISYWYNKDGGLESTNEKSLKTILRSGRSTPIVMAKSVILVCGTDRLLPKLNEELGMKAQRQLTQLGVQVMVGVRVEGVSDAIEAGKTTVKLSSGTHLVCDLYVPCTGVLPNTQFLPFDSPLLRDGFMATLFDENGDSTLRVDIPQELLPDGAVKVHEAGDLSTRRRLFLKNAAPQGITLPRVYAVGDCADYSNQSVQDVYASMKVLEQNLMLDLRAYQLAISNPYDGNQGAILDLYNQSMSYKRDQRVSQLIPIGGRKPGGVGVLKGYILPSWIVYLLKGRDYTVGKARNVVMQGLSPYPVRTGATRSGWATHG